MENIINSFSDQYAWASNMYIGKPLKVGNLVFSCVEAAYQAMKDLSQLENFQNIDGKTAKLLGKNVTLREDWETIKLPIMITLMRLKFNQDDSLKDKLLNTQNAIFVESNSVHDNVWGKCTCNQCINIKSKNYTGRILMKIRKELQEPRLPYGINVQKIPNFNVLTSRVATIIQDKYCFPIIVGMHINTLGLCRFYYNAITKTYKEQYLDYYCQKCGKSMNPQTVSNDFICDECKQNI